MFDWDMVPQPFKAVNCFGPDRPAFHHMLWQKRALSALAFAKRTG